MGEMSKWLMQKGFYPFEGVGPGNPIYVRVRKWPISDPVLGNPPQLLHSIRWTRFSSQVGPKSRRSGSMCKPDGSDPIQLRCETDP
ncbi:hypothetical protein V6N12_016109 [Hibiscus sabdariffa]|uniref:Uncharacterized protein n=1 Tax=Hibiscus sabdariffa TaxID=183260 RepID=A0ABR2C9F9_9ROSI